MPDSARTVLRLAALGLAIASTGCMFGNKKKPRAFVPPPVYAKPEPVASVPVLPPPDPELHEPATMPPAPDSLITLPGPPAPAPPKRPAVATAPKPAPPPPASTEPVPAAPKLGQIYTPEQAREYNRTIDESLDRVRRALASVAGRNLSPDQNQMAESIRTFQRQAESAREQDLVFAVSLARRADLLAKDLLARLP